MFSSFSKRDLVKYISAYGNRCRKIGTDRYAVIDELFMTALYLNDANQFPSNSRTPNAQVYPHRFSPLPASVGLPTLSTSYIL